MQEMQETPVPSLGQEAPLEGEMTTHSTILAWEIPWTEEPGRLQSMGSEKSWTQLIDGACTQPRPLALASPSPFQLSYKRHCIFFCKGFGENQPQVTDSADVKENRGGECPGWLPIVLPEGRPVPEQQLGCDHLWTKWMGGRMEGCVDRGR